VGRGAVKSLDISLLQLTSTLTSKRPWLTLGLSDPPSCELLPGGFTFTPGEPNHGEKS